VITKEPTCRFVARSGIRGVVMKGHPVHLFWWKCPSYQNTPSEVSKGKRKKERREEEREKE
jgi:hypothetical protein